MASFITRYQENQESPAPNELFVASPWQLVRWKFLRHKLATVSLAILAVFYLFVGFAEFLAPYDPRQHHVEFIHAPPHRLRFFDEAGRFHLRPFVYRMQKSMDPVTLRELYDEDTTQRLAIRFFVHGDRYRFWGLFESDLHFFGIEDGRLFLIGADGLGQDMLSRLIYGGRVSLSVGLVGVAISFVLGISIGGVSGYFGGPADLLIQRLIEFIRSIPTLPLWMGLSAALPPYWSMLQVYFGIVVILSLTGWTGLARVVRGKFMAVREEEFVMAAQLHGASKRRIIFKHLLPSFYSHVIASLTLAIPGMILGETALSFIGLGLQAPAISWGVLLREAQAIRVLANSPWILIPALFVIVAILAFNFVGDGLRDAADPYTAV